MTEIPARMREVVHLRDQKQCQACGEKSDSIQHRIGRGVGGQNVYSNLVDLCGSGTTGCHGKCEARDEQMHVKGFWLNSWESTTETPMYCWDGLIRLLDDNGDYRIFLEWV